MNAIKEARKIIEAAPRSDDAVILGRLTVCLETGEPFALNDLYRLGYDHFEVALKLIAEWRLDRHYAKRLKLLDASVQAGELGAPVEGARAAGDA